MDRERLDGWCEQVILGLVLAILVFGPLAMGGVDAWNLALLIPHSRSWQFLVIQTLTLAVMTLWLARIWLKAGPQLLWPPICWAVLGFAVYAIVRYTQADIEYAARQELIRVLIYAFLFFAILNNLHRQESTQLIALTLIVLGTAIALYAGWQFVTKSFRVWNVAGVYPGRATGTFIYPNNLAGFLEMLAPLALSYAVMGRFGHVARIFLGYAALVMVVGVGVTVSRGGAAVMALVVAVFCIALLFQRDYRFHAVVLIALLAATGWLVHPHAQAAEQRIRHTLQGGQMDDERLAIWEGAYHMWRDHRWWGMGPAQFDYRFRAYRSTRIQQRPGWVHNDYLNTLVDWGAAGAALVAVAWGLLFWGVFKTWRTVGLARDDLARSKSNKFALLIGASVGLLGILAHSAFDFNLHIPALAILTVTLMAILSSQLRFATERYWWKLRGTGKWVTTVLLAGGLGYLGYQECRATREYAALEWKAAKTTIVSHERIAALEEAFKAEPANFETTYAIAECYRGLSWRGGDQYRELAQQAMDWYQRGMKLNPYDGYNWLGYGRCLDWIGAGGEGQDSGPYFQHADELDPNGYFTSAYIGLHYAETGDYAAAWTWLERSRRLQWVDNGVATDWLPIVKRRLEEEAEKNK